MCADQRHRKLPLGASLASVFWWGNRWAVGSEFCVLQDATLVPRNHKRDGTLMNGGLKIAVAPRQPDPCC